MFRTAEHDPQPLTVGLPNWGSLADYGRGSPAVVTIAGFWGQPSVSVGREGICLGTALPPGPALPCHTDSESPSVPRDLLYPWVLTKPLALGRSTAQQRGGLSASARDFGRFWRTDKASGRAAWRKSEPEGQEAYKHRLELLLGSL